MRGYRGLLGSLGLLGLLGFCLVALPVSTCHAVDDNPMYTFYNGLADVVEKNMNNPGKCVAEAEKYIENNIAPLKEATERGRKMAASGQYDDMTAEDFEKMDKTITGAQGDAMAKGMEAMNRFMSAVGEFAQEYPDEGEQIFDALEKASPQDDY